jgi:sec-independent protein translocase protein TatA
MFIKNPITDVVIFLIVVLLIFGPKRLPLLGRQLGQGMREFKDGITGKAKESEESERPEIAQTSAMTAQRAPERQADKVSASEPRA